MKRCFILSLLCVTLAILLPNLGKLPPETAPLDTPAPVVTGSPDEGETIALRRGGETVTMPLADYLPGVVAAEMPASFASDALRAQAVAARTYTLYQKRHRRERHPEADVCDDPGCCQAWLDAAGRAALWGEGAPRWERAIDNAVKDTDGLVLTWEGEPILACFHASSAGSTESSAALWGRALPYLVSVPSPETAADVPGFVTTVELSADELRAGVRALSPDADLSGPPETWLGERVLDAGGRVAAMRLGGVALPGEKIRARFALRSTAFTLAWTGRSFLFTVTGNGHGVGLSPPGWCNAHPAAFVSGLSTRRTTGSPSRRTTSARSPEESAPESSCSARASSTFERISRCSARAP